MGTGITFTDGKLGTAATFPNNAEYCIHMSGQESQTGSWCAWINVVGAGSATKQYVISEGRDTGSVGTNIFLSQSGKTLYFDSHKKRVQTADNAIPLNTWIHVVGTFGNGSINLYINGELISSTTYTEDSDYAQSNNQLVLGKMSYYYSNKASYFPFNGQINDFRIYDHALSPKEIQVLSRGLMLHYTLSAPGNENLNREQISSSKWVNWAGAVLTTREKIEINGKIWAHVVQGSESSGSGYGGYTCGPADNKIEIDATKQYTLSVLAKRGIATNSIIRLWCHWRSSEGGGNLAQNSIDIPLTKDIQRVSVTWTAPTNDTYTVNRINLMIGSAKPDNELYFTDIKFEEGSKPTPWMPNPEDEIYSKLGYDDTTEYDVSGYKHNGVKTGIQYSSDTVKYNTSTLINSEENNIILSGLKTTGFKDSFSISWWAKVSIFSGKMMWGFMDGNRLNGIYNGNLWNTGDGSNNPIYEIGTTTQITVPTVDVWHHFVMTGDGTKNYLYVDGILYGESKIYKPLQGTSLVINGFDLQEHYKYTSSRQLLISDFRIYATALSPEAVLELYHTAATLSSNGVLMTNEFVEG